MAAVAAALAPPQLLDPLALADFEAGLDGLHENDLVDEAEVDSIVREAILHTIGETPWTDSKVCRLLPQQKGRNSQRDPLCLPDLPATSLFHPCTLLEVQVASWTSHIIEGTLKKLAALQKPMKYVCKVGLTQRSGAGLHAACCSRWNPKTDGAHINDMADAFGVQCATHDLR